MVHLKGCHALTNTDRLHRVEERHDGHFAGHLLADRLDKLESLRLGEGVLEALDEPSELRVVVPAAPAGPSRLGARRRALDHVVAAGRGAPARIGRPYLRIADLRRRKRLLRDFDPDLPPVVRKRGDLAGEVGRAGDRVAVAASVTVVAQDAVSTGRPARLPQDSP